jgi:hypothetical protein
MIFTPAITRRLRPEPLLGAPRLSWAGVFVYRKTQDGADRIGASRTTRRACSPALFRAAQDGTTRVTQSGASRAIYNA